MTSQNLSEKIYFETIFNKAINDTWKFCFNDINKDNHRSTMKTNIYHTIIGKSLDYILNKKVIDFDKKYQINMETNGSKIPIIDTSGEDHAVDGVIVDTNKNPVVIIAAKFPLMSINKNRNNLYESKNGLVNRIFGNSMNGVKGILFFDFIPNYTLTNRKNIYNVEEVKHKGFNSIEKNGTSTLLEKSYPHLMSNIYEINVKYDLNFNLSKIKNKTQLHEALLSTKNIANVSEVCGIDNFASNFEKITKSEFKENDYLLIKQNIHEINNALKNITQTLDNITKLL